MKSHVDVLTPFLEKIDPLPSAQLEAIKAAIEELGKDPTSEGVKILAHFSRHPHLNQEMVETLLRTGIPSVYPVFVDRLENSQDMRECIDLIVALGSQSKKFATDQALCNRLEMALVSKLEHEDLISHIADWSSNFVLGDELFDQLETIAIINLHAFLNDDHDFYSYDDYLLFYYGFMRLCVRKSRFIVMFTILAQDVNESLSESTQFRYFCELLEMDIDLEIFFDQALKFLAAMDTPERKQVIVNWILNFIYNFSSDKVFLTLFTCLSTPFPDLKSSASEVFQRWLNDFEENPDYAKKFNQPIILASLKQHANSDDALLKDLALKALKAIEG